MGVVELGGRSRGQTSLTPHRGAGPEMSSMTTAPVAAAQSRLRCLLVPLTLLMGVSRRTRKVVGLRCW